jgi:hypothetical protein
MQRQSWHEEEKYQHDAQLDEKQQDQSSKFFFVDLEQMRRHGCARFPQEERQAEIEQGEYEADNECTEEKVPEKNDLVAFHVAIIYFSDARSITNL